LTVLRTIVQNPGERARTDYEKTSAFDEDHMVAAKLLPIDRDDVAPLAISERLRGQLVYFMTPPGTPGIPALEEDEFWIARDEVAKWLDDGVFYLVSPLDSANATEVELTEEQESLLTWLQKHAIQHVRLLKSRT
jgi:hypothetical protein